MPDNNTSKLKKIYLIAQSHIDPAFMWDQAEGTSCMLNTFSSAADMLEEDPDLFFSASSMELFEKIKTIRPELFARLLKLYRTGRLFVSGSWYVEADTMLSGGEPLIRQALLGRMLERNFFGSNSDILMLLDSFGHPAELPKILNHCGIRSLILSRPNQKQLPLAHPSFDFMANDGNSVKTFRIPISYSTYTDEVERVKNLLDMEKSSQSSMCFFGIGDHGGGPTRAQIARMKKFIHSVPKDLKITFATPKTFFTEWDDNCHDVFSGMLEPSMIGCYSTVINLKQAHDQAVNLLLMAERASVLAGDDGHTESLAILWKKVLEAEFHDYLPGTAIESALRRQQYALQGVIAQAQTEREFHYQQIARKINTDLPNGYVYFIVFNDTPLGGTHYPEYEPWLFWQHWHKYHILDENGMELSCQRIHSNAAAPAIPHLIIPLQMEPFSYRTLRVAGPEPDLDHLGVAEDGFAEMAEKDCDMLPPELPKLQFQLFDDSSDTWSIKLDRYESRVAGFFAVKHIRQIENGPYRFVWRQKLQWGNSLIEVDYIRYSDRNGIRLNIRMDFQEKHKVLKMALAVDSATTKISRGTPFGCNDLSTDGKEKVFHRFILASGSNSGKNIAILSPGGIHGVSACENQIRLTLLRTPLFCHEEISRSYSGGAYHHCMNLGLHEFAMEIIEDGSTWTVAELNQRAQAIANPPLVITTDRHQGAWHSHGQMLSLAPKNLELSAFKPAENRSGVIIRVAETAGFDSDATLSWHDRQYYFKIGGHQLKTFCITEKGTFSEVNGAEEPSATNEQTVIDDVDKTTQKNPYKPKHK